MTQEQKQAIWAAGWLAKDGDAVRYAGEWEVGEWVESVRFDDKSDAELIQYAKEKGMELPAELTGWQPIDQIPEEWKKDNMPLLLSDGPGMPAYEGYFQPFDDYEISDHADWVKAGQDLETRRKTGGYWYTRGAYANDGEYGCVGDGFKSPKFARFMPEPPKETTE